MTPEDPAGWFTLHGLLVVVGLLVYTIGSHTLHQRRHPSAAVGWVLALVLVPEAALPLYLLFGTRKLPKAQVRGRVRDAHAGPDGAPRWTRHLTASMGLAPATAYRALRVHEDGRQAAQALFEVIDAARVRLDLCTFILGRDAFSAELLERLGQRARAGVQVRLIVDGVGALMGGRREFAEVQALGVQVLRFAPPFRAPWKWPLRGRTNLRNHRKLVLADGGWLWSGGRNLAGEYFEGGPGRAPWLDLSFDLQGPLAAEAAEIFEADWRFALDPRHAAMGPAQDAPAHEATVVAPEAPVAQLLPSGPDHVDDTVHTMMVAVCHRARERIVAVTPYLVPDESLLLALVLAARRGVQVDLVVPERSNHLLADIARNRPMRELARAGARLWLSPAMVHAKAMVVDDRFALAGSVNLDSRSLYLNYELMTAFYDHGDVLRFGRWIDALMPQARPYQARPPGLLRNIGEGLVLWLAFQL